jgi:rhodanese-related sulfurtransferase
LERPLKTLIFSLILAAAALSALAKDVIIDVRTPAEFATGHVEGAINIEYGNIATEIGKAGVGKDDKVALYCQSGRRSGIALDTLKGLGFSKAENVGGIEQARKVLTKK